MSKQAKGMKSVTNLAFESTYATQPTSGKWYVQPINKNELTGKQSLIQSNRECKIVCVNRYCMNLLYAPYWGKQR